MSENEKSGRSQRRQRLAIVTSDKMDKTLVVRWERLVRHPEYGRVVRRGASFKVHDERNQAKTGDQVLIAETRKLSKDKRWRLVSVVRQSLEVPDDAEPSAHERSRGKSRSIKENEAAS